MRSQQGLQIVPFIRPYRVRADIQTWFGDPFIFDLVQDEFKRGYYRGIGEFHISGKAAEGEWVKKTVDFAVEHDLYLHAHADDIAVEILMRHNPRARIIWAHTGFGLSTDRVSEMLSKYPKLWGELSYRGGIVDGGGKLTAEWRALFERYPDRFLLGSDTWINERWESYGDIMAGLPRLARAVAAKDRGADRQRQCEGAVRRRALSARREGRLNPQTRNQKLASGDIVEAKFRGEQTHSDALGTSWARRFPRMPIPSAAAPIPRLCQKPGHDRRQCSEKTPELAFLPLSAMKSAALELLFGTAPFW